MGEAAGAGTALFDTALFDVGELEPEPPAPPRWAEVLGVFDLETTGVDPATARIVTASVALLDEQGVVVERHDWIADPGVEIPAGAAAVHGIDTARAQRFGRAPAQVVPEILAAIATLFDRGIPLVVYNAPYDLTLLAHEARRAGCPPLHLPAPIIDPLVLDKAVDRYRRGKRTLTAAAAEYGVPLTDAHDAGADAIAAGRLAQAIARRHAGELAGTAAALHERQVDWCREQAARFEEYMQRTHDPAFTTSGAWPCR
jgi:DNA polymerase-3 subunit epsilon